MTIPAWLWAVAAGGLVAAVAAEIVLTGRPGHGSFTVRRAIRWAAVYVSLAAVFGLAVGATAGWPVAGQFYGGYLTEYSLSLDNLFIFYVIMSWFAVPAARQHRVLFLGIGLALVLRISPHRGRGRGHSPLRLALLPDGRLPAVDRRRADLRSLRQPAGGPAHPAEVLAAAPHPARPSDDDGQPPDRLAGPGGRWPPRLLLLAVAIGLADVAFAFDSIPAVFGITTSAALIVACNVFALMGLRQLYVLLVRTLDRIVYLHIGLAVICAFIGVKLLLEALDSSGVAWAVNIPAWISVTVVAAVLLITVVAGLVASAGAGEITGRGGPRPGGGTGNAGSRSSTPTGTASGSAKTARS